MDEALDIADYASDAIKVAEIKGKGRGLVATRRIERGELVMVQGPLGSGRSDRKRLRIVSGINLFTETSDPYAVIVLIVGGPRWEAGKVVGGLAEAGGSRRMASALPVH